MFGRNKQKNVRKKEKRAALNVRGRAGERRIRAVGTLFCFSMSLFLLVMLGWKGVEWILREALYSNPQLAIDRIDVESDGVVAPETIREWARVKTGDNLLALDLTRVKAELEMRPIIESASVEKILPRHLRITVAERKPVAMVYLYQAARAQLVFLDATGMVIPPLRPGERNPAAEPNPSPLPVLTGFDSRELRPGHVVQLPQLHAAIKLLEQYDASPVSMQTDFRTLDLSSPGTLIVTTDQNIEITFASYSYPRQLARLQTTLDYGRRIQRTLASLDLAVGNYVPARWQVIATNAPAAAPISAPAPHAPQLLKPRKKHV